MTYKEEVKMKYAKRIEVEKEVFNSLCAAKDIIVDILKELDGSVCERKEVIKKLNAGIKDVECKDGYEVHVVDFVDEHVKIVYRNASTLAIPYKLVNSALLFSLSYNDKTQTVDSKGAIESLNLAVKFNDGFIKKAKNNYKHFDALWKKKMEIETKVEDYNALILGIGKEFLEV